MRLKTRDMQLKTRDMHACRAFSSFTHRTRRQPSARRIAARPPQLSRRVSRPGRSSRIRELNLVRKKLSRKRATCTLHVARFQSLNIYLGSRSRAENSDEAAAAAAGP